MTAVVALTERIVRNSLRDDLPFALLAPIGNFVIFNLALRNVIDTGKMSYPQYLLPVIVIQATLLGALTTTDRAATDYDSEFGVRLSTLPISPMVPLTARMLYCAIRGFLALVAATLIGYVFGFRMNGGPGLTAAFAILTLTFTLALSLGADAVGVWIAEAAIGRSGGASQLLLVPQLLLVMLSTGMAPAESFPGWLQPFVRYQPVSQVTETLRGFSSGSVETENLAASLIWCIGMLVVFGAIALRLQRRTR